MSKKVLLVYLPFCTPASPPYSLTAMAGFLQGNSSCDVEVLDLNSVFHCKRFSEYKEYFQDSSKWENYEGVVKKYNKETVSCYSENNKAVVEGGKPELFNELLSLILEKKPDVVAFSIVYSSQAFYCHALLKEFNKLKKAWSNGTILNKKNSIKNKSNEKLIIDKENHSEHNESIENKKPIIESRDNLKNNNSIHKENKKSLITDYNGKVETVIGGPSVNEKLIELSDHYLKNEVEFLNFLEGKEVKHEDLNFNTIPDFSQYDFDNYFVPEPVVPLKTSSTCYYKQCTFCAHYANVPYHETQLDLIEETIKKSGQRYFFLIDDMIPTKRLLELAEVFKRNNAKWACQLKPTNQLTLEVLKVLYDSGLKMIIWGVESGNQRVLDLMKKGTHLPDIQFVLKNSHEAGIKNVTYILFGFPGETEDEFKDTVKMLLDNSDYIDLVSLSVFGLQKGTPVYKEPEKYGITKVEEEERTVLEPKITYEVSLGLSQKEATKLKNKYRARIELVNTYPNAMNFFREHMFIIC